LLRHTQDALDSTATALGECAHAFFFDRRKAASEITRRDRILPDGLTVSFRLSVSRIKIPSDPGRYSSRKENVAEANHLHYFLENGCSTSVYKGVEQLTYNRIPCKP
jgi:hypothetical protein